jgi:hypothetical protein
MLDGFEHGAQTCRECWHVSSPDSPRASLALFSDQPVSLRAILTQPTPTHPKGRKRSKSSLPVPFRLMAHSKQIAGQHKISLQPCPPKNSPLNFKKPSTPPNPSPHGTGSRSLKPAHLLLALLEQEGGIASPLFEKAAVNPAAAGIEERRRGRARQAAEGERVPAGCISRMRCVNS